MSFVGDTVERKITTQGKTYKIFVTEQVGGDWVATILYADDGKVTTNNEFGKQLQEAYDNACYFVRKNIDPHAQIEDL